MTISNRNYSIMLRRSMIAKAGLAMSRQVSVERQAAHPAVSAQPPRNVYRQPVTGDTLPPWHPNYDRDSK